MKRNRTDELTDANGNGNVMVMIIKSENISHKKMVILNQMTRKEMNYITIIISMLLMFMYIFVGYINS